MFFARLLAQLLAFIERFAFGKWLIWMFDMLLAGATWMFRGFGQMLLALVLLVTGQQVVEKIPSINLTPTWQSKYGFTVSQSEAHILGEKLKKEPLPAGRTWME